MALTIKNLTQSTKVYAGQEILADSSYIIPDSELSAFRGSDKLMSDLSLQNPEAVIEENGQEFTGTDAIKLLLGDIPKNEDGLPIFAPTFEETQGLTVVWKGILHTAAAGALSIFDEVVTTQIKVRGGWYELMDDNAAVGDYIEFSIVDKDDVLGLFATYGLTQGVDVLELKKFIRKEYINPRIVSRQDFESDGASTVYPGLYMRVAYYSTGAEDVQFKIMEKYHEI